jgi:kinesin family protein 6/9
MQFLLRFLMIFVCVGQTGSGKTYTMTGASESFNQRGIIPRAVNQLFREIKDKQNLLYTIRVSYLEIYNECLIDLLSPNATSPDLVVVETPNGKILFFPV